MNTLWQAPALAAIVIGWLTAPPTGFAEISRREAMRRMVTAASVKSLSNHDLPVMELVAPATAAASATAVADPPPEIALGGEVVLTTQPQPATPAPGAPRTVPVADEEAPAAPAKAAAGAAAPAAAAAAAPSAKDEKAWRERIAGARAALERDQVLLDAMQTRINSLNTDVINRDDPAQQAQLRVQLQRAVAEQARLQKQVAAGTKAIADIQTEARRLGVPPGWVR